jgi:hypothetical protein
MHFTARYFTKCYRMVIPGVILTLKNKSTIAFCITEVFRDIETTSFDPASVFLNFLYIVYLLYCYFTQ